MNSENFTFLSSNNEHIIHAWIISPDQGEIKGIVQIAHGMKEYFLRYDEAITFFVNNGYVVCGNDHLSQGHSTKGKPGYMGKGTTYHHIAADMRCVFKTAGKRYEGKPYFMLGHSMGSFLTRYYITKWGYELDGVLLSGTGDAGILTRIAYRAAIKFCDMEVFTKGANADAHIFEEMSLGGYAKKFGPIKTKAAWQTSDEQKAREFIEDPLCDFYFTYQGYRELLKVINYISLPRWPYMLPKQLPVFIFSGAMDPVGLFGKSVKIVYNKLKDAGMQFVTMKIYDHGRHEMFNETNRQDVYSDVVKWLDNYSK